MTLILKNLALAAMAALAVNSAFAANDATSTAAPPKASAVEQLLFASVDDVPIPASEYDVALREAARQKFYHGTPPESQVTELRREVGWSMIDRILLMREAKARNIGPDRAAVDAKIASYEARYKDSPRWQEQRESVLPNLRARLEQDSILENIEAEARRLPPAAESKVRGYYAANPDKFTEPEKLKLAIILLSVDPSSTSEIWQMAREEAARLREKLVKGEDFSKLAALHSSDESAANGGEMEYIHRGMTPSALQETIDQMKVGEISDPVRILEGVALFKLLDRKAPIHHGFERVRERATDLYDRERADQAWEEFKRALRGKARLVINTERYPAFADLGGSKAKAP